MAVHPSLLQIRVYHLSWWEDIFQMHVICCRNVYCFLNTKLRFHKRLCFYQSLNSVVDPGFPRCVCEGEFLVNFFPENCMKVKEIGPGDWH